MDGMQIDDLDLKNFNDFEDNMSNDFQDAQEQWPEEIDFSPQDLPEEESGGTTFRDEKEILNASTTDTAVSHIPQHSAARTVGQKWQPASTPENSGRMVLPDASINLPGSSGLSTASQKGQGVTTCRIRATSACIHMEASGGQRTTAVASVKPMAVEGDFHHSMVPILSPGVPVLMALPQTAHVWAANPLVRVKVSDLHL